MKQIREDIRKNQFAPVYLLYGEESYLRKETERELIHALVPDGNSMNFTRYEGKDIREEEIIAQADTMPFFADRRVILVQDSGFLKKKTELLADYMKNIPSYLVIVFSEEEADKRNRLYKAVSKAGHTAEFRKQSADVLMKWVLSRISAEGKKIRRADMEYFMATAGNDMGRIDQELEKLFCYTMDRDVITAEDIRAICSPEIQGQIFDMVRAVAEHNQKKAMELYDELLALKEPPMRILYLLSREFRQLYLIRMLLEEGEGTDKIASRVGLPPFVVRKYIPLCRKYKTGRLRQAMEDFARAETDVKTGKLGDVMSVEMMIVQYSA